MTSPRDQRLARLRDARHRYRPSRRQFQELVADAVASLPEEFRSRLDNIEIVVEEWPRRSAPESVEDEGSTLLGLYQGTPLGQRGTSYHLASPDRISIYRGPILAVARSREEVLREIRDTVYHEIGHYFGLLDHELD